MASSISNVKVFNDASILQAGTVSETVDLNRFSTEGFFSLQIEITGAGNVDVVWSVSNDGTNFVTPTGTAPIFDDFGAASGPGTDGLDIASFSPPLAKFLKITATENNAGAITLISCDLAIQ